MLYIKREILKITFAIFLVTASTALFAQPGGGGGGQGQGGPPPTGVPIDGGAAALLVAAGLYGAMQLKAKKQNKNTLE